MEETFFTCSHCWEKVSILVDISANGNHVFIEDCEVCCNPLEFRVRIESNSVADLQVEPAQ